MENRKIKVGIIGAGRMGITHYAILNSHPDVVVAAVVDTTPVVNSLIEKYLDVRTYKNYSALLDREILDAVVLCTPPALNYEILLAANRKGVHAFVEKPGTLSAAQAAELAGLYGARGLVNQVGYVNRFNDVFVTVKRLIEQDVVGDVIRFRSEMYSRTVIREESGSSWRSTREQGGGAVYEMASHSIDLVNYFFGRPDAVAGTCLSRVYSNSVEDIVSSSFLYKSGAVGSLYVNWSDESYRKPTNKIEIFGKRGRILADQHGLKVHLGEANEKLGFRAGWNSLSITDVFTSVPFFVRGIEFTAQLYHFIDCVKSGDAAGCRCTFRNAADALYVIEDLFRDASEIARVVNK
jgi:predicted dehydrogenase